MRHLLLKAACAALAFLAASNDLWGAETVWIEAEHLRVIHGSCFPDMEQTTDGRWGLSGPGIAPEWTQGGESEWLSVACGPDDDRAEASHDFEVPEPGEWTLWVRYRDWRKQTERFAVRIDQAGRRQEFVFGEQPVVDEDDELKLFWQWVFGWDSRPLKLAKGPAKLTLLAHAKQPVHRQVDCFCLTTDRDYHPHHREKPSRFAWQLLDELRTEPKVAPLPLAARAGEFAAPVAWKPTTFRDKGFLYLWNVGGAWLEDLVSQDPKRVLVPYGTEPALAAPFRAAFGGRADVPIFSDPRIVPTFHGAGPSILDNPHVVAWLAANPGRPWANMMNYFPPQPISEAAKANWRKLAERYVGNISGESLGHYVAYDAEALNARLKTAKSRGEALAAFAELFLAANVAKQTTLFGEAVTDPYLHTVPCQSSGMTAFAHAAREWGARTVGYESSTPAGSLAMRLAFLRGGARQYGGLWATYRSCNFGDASTIYSEQGMYPGPKYVYDNSYDAWAGAGMTWYKFDLWHQYLSGSAMFYHEQGFDEFWMPGGGATPRKPIQLSPKGRLVDEFLQLTKKHPDRGTPFTPIAFLLDRAHGWEPNGFRPSYFGFDEGLNPFVLCFDRHARMLREWFQAAYHPYGPKEAELNTGVTPNFVPGVFGDIFDVLVTDPAKLDVLQSYPVIVLNGEVELSLDVGKKLAAYVTGGGTLIASDEQLRGPGVAELQLPKLGNHGEATQFAWRPSGTKITSQRFRYRAIEGGQILAATDDGSAVAAAFERGKGRLVFLSVPRGLGIDDAATPLVGLVLASARQGLLPVEVIGEVEWLFNRTQQGWLVALFNPAGNVRLQHGVGVTDYSRQRTVTIHAPAELKTAAEWFTETALPVEREEGRSAVKIVVPAGGVRILDLR